MRQWFLFTLMTLHFVAASTFAEPEQAPSKAARAFQLLVKTATAKLKEDTNLKLRIHEKPFANVVSTIPKQSIRIAVARQTGPGTAKLSVLCTGEELIDNQQTKKKKTVPFQHQFSMHLRFFDGHWTVVRWLPTWDRREGHKLRGVERSVNHFAFELIRMLDTATEPANFRQRFGQQADEASGTTRKTPKQTFETLIRRVKKKIDSKQVKIPQPKPFGDIRPTIEKSAIHVPVARMTDARSAKITIHCAGTYLTNGKQPIPFAHRFRLSLRFFEDSWTVVDWESDWDRTNLKSELLCTRSVHLFAHQLIDAVDTATSAVEDFIEAIEQNRKTDKGK